MPLPRATPYIQEHHGVPTLFIDGKPHCGFGRMLSDADATPDSGDDLLSFAVSLDFSPGPEEFSAFDRRMDCIVEKSPNAHVLPRIALDWPVTDPSGGRLSFASKAWLTDAGIALQRLLRHAEERYGDRIIGYRLDAGEGGRWFANPDGDPSINRSRAEQEAFREWLTTRQFPNVEPDPIPTDALLRGSEYGIFREPANMAAAAVVEYWRFISDAVVSAIAYFAKLAREAVGPHKLLGACYGVPGQGHHSGQLALRKFLDDANLDFGCGPVRSAAASFAARGKLWWNELSQEPDAARREFAAVLCGASGAWWHGDAGAADPDRVRMLAIARRSLDFKRSPVAEVAVVLDDDSVCYTADGNPLTALVDAQLDELARTGTPFSMLHGDDLTRAKKHRFYLILNHFSLSSDRERQFQEIAQAGDVTLLFVYAVGLIGQAVAPTRMMRVLGMSPIELSPYPAFLRVATEGEHGEPIEYGVEGQIAPVISCEDRRGEVLGRLVISDRAGLVRKRIGRSTVIYSSAPHLPATLLRRLFRDAGVHLFTDAGRSVWANESFIAVATDAGERSTLTMPAGEKLYDLFAGQEIELRDGKAELPGEVTVLFRGNGRTWRE